MNKQTFNVTGMTCSACSAHVEKAVSRVAGVQSVTVNLLSNSMTVEFDAPADAEALLRAVEDAGYGASVPGAQTSPAGETERTKKTAAQDELRGMRTRLAVSLLFLIPLMYLSMGHMLGWPLPAVFHGIPRCV